MSQIISPSIKILDESTSLMSTLEQQAHVSPFACDALRRQRAVHGELERCLVQSEQALSEWRIALTRRWQCEIACQRVYMQILHHLRESFGESSPQIEVIAPDYYRHSGSAVDLLNDLRRMHASLKWFEDDLCLPNVQAAHLEACCNALHETIEATQHLEMQRRQATIERQLAEDACHHAVVETLRQLDNGGGSHIIVQPPAYVEALAYVE